jgi:hypothetical protein
MMKPASEAVAAAKNAVANETVTVAKGSCNLVPLCHSLLPSVALCYTPLHIEEITVVITVAFKSTREGSQKDLVRFRNVRATG